MIQGRRFPFTSLFYPEVCLCFVVCLFYPVATIPSFLSSLIIFQYLVTFAVRTRSFTSH